MKKILAIMLVAAVLTGAFSTVSLAQGKLYTAYNLWYEYDRAGKLKPMNGINYKRGNIIPAGTEVKNISLKNGRRGTTVIEFETAKKGRKFTINYQEKYHPGIDGETLKKRLFSGNTFKELTKGFTTMEMKSVETGTIRGGIRKKAVLVAYGYPPEHRTESIEINTWIYWLDRFRTMRVVFNDEGKVISE